MSKKQKVIVITKESHPELWLLNQKFMIKKVLEDDPTKLARMQKTARGNMKDTGVDAELRDWILASCPE